MYGIHIYIYIYVYIYIRGNVELELSNLQISSQIIQWMTLGKCQSVTSCRTLT